MAERAKKTASRKNLKRNKKEVIKTAVVEDSKPTVEDDLTDLALGVYEDHEQSAANASKPAAKRRHPLAVKAAMLSYLRKVCKECTVTAELEKNQLTKLLELRLRNQVMDVFNEVDPESLNITTFCPLCKKQAHINKCNSCLQWLCHSCRDDACKQKHRQLRSELSAAFWENMRDLSPESRDPSNACWEGNQVIEAKDEAEEEADFWSAMSVTPYLVTMHRRFLYKYPSARSNFEPDENESRMTTGDLFSLHEDDVVVTDEKQVLRIKDGEQLWSYENEKLGQPCRVVSADERLLIRWSNTTTNSHCLSWLGQDGAGLQPCAEHLERPYGLGITRLRHLLVTDVLDGTAHLLSSSGEVLHRFQTGLDYPAYVHGTSRGAILVSDPRAHRVRMYDALGAALWDYGMPGRGMTSLHGPASLASDDQGNIFICDKGNARVVMLSPDGIFIQMLVSDLQPTGKRVSDPTGIDIDEVGHVVVLDKTNISSYHYK